MKQIPSSEITPEPIYRNRRQFLKTLGFGLAAATLAACGKDANQADDTGNLPEKQSTLPADAVETKAPFSTEETDELGRALTRYEDVISYNNFYEFSVSKGAVAPLARDFPTSPWQLEVGGLVNKPEVFSMEDIYSQFVEEERIYRMRCVEGWAMVIPWLGFPLWKLLERVEPLPSARYVYFETIVDEKNMPGVGRGAMFDFPYTEGLRLDEAMHDLTILSTGLYGKHLLPQNGAPIRLVVPWKYGFKNIKSLVKIELVEEMPRTFWNLSAPDEYGFYANVNPNVDHPRWSQATETLVGADVRRIPTLLFNGYDEVASLYDGMDLSVWY